MIYHLNQLVNWENPKTETDKIVAKGIAELRAKYFGEDKPNLIQLEDKKGRVTYNVSGYWEPTKIFPMELVGGLQGEYRYTAVMPTLDDKGNPKFSDSRQHVKHILELREDQIELAYFLLTHNNQVRRGRIKIIDEEADALAIATKEAQGIELKHYLFSPSSPIANSQDVLKDIAITFGIPGINSLGINQIKNRIKEVVDAGDKSNNRFVNTAMFMTLIGSDEMREVARVIYDAVEKKDLIYSSRDFAWHFSSGGDLGESILNVPGKDQANAVQLLINGCVNKPELRKAVFGFLGKINYKLDAFRKKTILVLREEAKKREIKFNMNTPKEDLVKAIAEIDGIDYEPPTPL